MLVAAPTFVPYTPTLRTDLVGAPASTSVWVYSTDIVERRLYNYVVNASFTNSSDFYYYKDPSVKFPPPVSDSDNEAFETYKNTGIYYIEDGVTCPVGSPANSLCRNHMYRNGVRARFISATPSTATSWSFSAWLTGAAPVANWSYVTETLTYSWNKTSGTGLSMKW